MSQEEHLMEISILRYEFRLWMGFDERNGMAAQLRSAGGPTGSL